MTRRIPGLAWPVGKVAPAAVITREKTLHWNGLPLVTLGFGATLLAQQSMLHLDFRSGPHQQPAALQAPYI